MATTYTLTGQVTDALDSSPEALTRLSGYAQASQPLINDTGTNTQRVGRVPLTFDSDGNFSVALVGTGSLVAGWRVVLNWRDSTFRSQEQTYSTGYFTMTANKTFAAAIIDGGSGSVIPITPTLDASVAALIPSGSATSAAVATAIGRKRPTLPGEPVGSYGGGAYAENGLVGTGGVTWFSLHKMAVGATEIRLVYTSGYFALSNANGEQVASNSHPIKASVQVGTFLYRVTFNGARQGVADPGGTLISDPIAIDLAAGTQFTVRTYENIANGAKWNAQMGQIGPGVTYVNGGAAGGAGGAGYTIGSDLTDVLTTFTSAAPGMYGGPSLIIGTPKGLIPGKSLFAVGDSIDAGYGDDSSNYNSGWVLKAVNGQIPVYRGTYASTFAVGFRNSHAYSGILAANFTHALVGYGANDLIGSRTAAQIEADLTAIHQLFHDRGLKVLQRTLTPYTTSTDSWATVGNQTVTAYEAVRLAVNAWIRANGSGLIDQIIETADTVESARDSGKWKAGTYTADGLHPNSTGSTAMATALNVGSLP